VSAPPRGSSRGWAAEDGLPAAGFLDRVACFETLRVYGGRIFRLTEHLGRLADSCKGIGAPFPLDVPALSAWVEGGLKGSGHADALLRLSVHAAAGGGTALVLMVRPFAAHPAAWYRDGVAIRMAVGRRSSAKAQDPQIKASQFMTGVVASLDTASDPAPAHEIVLSGPAGTVAEGTVSNLFAVKAKRLLTPSVASGILRGVTRGVVLEAARREGLEVVETFLTRHEFYAADECFLTNTSSEVLPVIRFDGRVIGKGRPGPVTRKLARAFRRAVKGT